MINRLVAHTLPFFPKALVWRFSRSYIAGENAADAITACRSLNDRGGITTIDILGESIANPSEAKYHRDAYLLLMDLAKKEGIDGNFSLKPTMFGLLVDPATCHSHIREIVSKAALMNNFIRIDMEDSQCVDMEIELFKKLRAEFPKNVGLVLQAYMRRTFTDLETLNEVNSAANPINFRLCKGIYIEPEAIAFKGYQEVRDHFLADLRYMLENKMYAGIATHDRYLVEESLKMIHEMNIPKDMYEFQMLYGVTPELRQSIVDDGHKMRVYVPYGKQWFGYSTRRLKENPKMAQHIIKALFIRG